MAVQTLASSVASQAAPTLDSLTAGKAINDVGVCDEAIILVRSTAGSGTMTATVTIWGLHAELGVWFKVKGLNGAAAIAETTADAINYAETVSGLRRFSRLHAEVATAGTNPTVSVYADPIRATAGTR